LSLRYLLLRYLLLRYLLRHLHGLSRLIRHCCYSMLTARGKHRECCHCKCPKH
jgi:hypothetical protein